MPPAGVRAKFLHKIRNLDDKKTEVVIIHEVSTDARPVHEAVNAETVGVACEPIWASKTSLARTREPAAKPLAHAFSRGSLRLPK